MYHHLGIEIGGTKLQFGLGAGDGTISRLVRRQVEPSLGAEGVRGQIVDATRDMLTEIRSIGIGFGGPVDADRGVVIKSNQIARWENFPLVDWVRTALGIERVTLQNDADTAALGEARFGAGRGLSPVLYVNSGSGIGGGLIVDGKIYRGSGLGAIEIGHVVLDDVRVGETYVNEDTTFPIMTTLEDVASGWGMVRNAARNANTRRLFGSVGLAVGDADDGLLAMAGGDPKRITMPMIVRSARENPTGLAARILSRATISMGRVLANAVTLLAPRRVILGGGVSLIGDDLWLDPIRQYVDERVFSPFRGTFDVVRAELGEDVVVHGALALARDACDRPSPAS
jgi:glucokinase